MTRRGAIGLAASVTSIPAAIAATGDTATNKTAHLFPGEEVIHVNGYPSLIRFQPSSGVSPLVVFVPGTSFLARIAYGYPGGRSTDFLSHWLVEAGFPFLGTSYPLDNPVYTARYPAFTITDWAQQVAGAARRTIDANRLGNKIIVVGWSMGGKIVEKVAQAARIAGLDLTLFVALDALPPGLNLFPGNAEQFTLAPNGLVDQSTSLLPWFNSMIEIQGRINGHPIMSAADLRQLFTGNPPLDLQGEAARYRDGRIVQDVAAAMQDGGGTDYGQYPPIALIVSNGAADYPNVLLCRGNWALCLGQGLYRRQVYPHRDRIPALAAQRWDALQAIFNGAVQRLTIQVAGTHFLFLGEIGARATASAIAALAQRSAETETETAGLIA